MLPKNIELIKNIYKNYKMLHGTRVLSLSDIHGTLNKLIQYRILTYIIFIYTFVFQ